MNKQDYYKLLLADEWADYSYIIKKRDNFKCVKCGSDRVIQAHHLCYREGFKPWDYPQSWVITLCKICHSAEHKKNSINSFFTKEVPNNPDKRKKKQKKSNTKYVKCTILNRKEQKKKEYQKRLKQAVTEK